MAAKHGGGGGGHKESHGGGGGHSGGGGGGSGELGELFSLATLKEIFSGELSSKEWIAGVLQTVFWISGAGYLKATLEGIIAAEGWDKLAQELGLDSGKKPGSGHGGHGELGGGQGGGEKKGGGGGGRH